MGNSTRVDPILQQQVNLQEAVSHQLVTMLKAGTAVPGKLPHTYPTLATLPISLPLALIFLIKIVTSSMTVR